MTIRYVLAGAVLGSVLAALPAEAALFMTPDTADGNVNRADSGGALSTANLSATTITSGTYQATDRVTVFVFQLPTLGPGESFDSATLSLFNSENYANQGVQNWNLDLYALPARAAAAIQAGDYYNGALDPTAGVSLIEDNFVAQGTTGASTTYSTSASALVDYLNAQYDGGNGAGKYVFFRVSPDAAGSNLPNDRLFKWGTADHGTPSSRPSLEYSVVPEPGAALIALALLPMLRRRRTP